MLLLCAQPRSFSESVEDFPSSVCLSVPRFPSGISCSTRPFYKLAFFKREIFWVVFSIKGKNRHQTCTGASLGCFTPGEGVPVHRILRAGRILGLEESLSPKACPQVPQGEGGSSFCLAEPVGLACLTSGTPRRTFLVFWPSLGRLSHKGPGTLLPSQAGSCLRPCPGSGGQGRDSSAAAPPSIPPWHPSIAPARSGSERRITCSHLHRYRPCCPPGSAPRRLPGSPPASPARRAPDPAPPAPGAAGRGGAGRPRRGGGGGSGVCGDGDAGWGIRKCGNAGAAARRGWGLGACEVQGGAGASGLELRGTGV